jgi:hypothetical protein
MITQFKIYENIRHAWVVPLKMPDFLMSLKKIGMDDKEIDNWMRLHKNGVFIEYGSYPYRETITIDKENDGYTWFWCPITDSDENRIFMGRIEFTKKDIQDYYDEIEFQKGINKFNI